MKWLKPDKKQTLIEEKWNIYTHFFGILIGLVGLFALIQKVMVSDGSMIALFSVSVFGLSFILLYTSSTVYHAQSNPIKKQKLRLFDHASIYLLIAGSYTPITLLVLGGEKGWIYFIIEWSMAFIGILLKVFFIGRFEKVSLIIYLIMGWLIVFDLPLLMERIPSGGFKFIMYGGLAYTLGAVFYAANRIKFSHVIWHFFVLAGSLFHFWFVYRYAIQ